MQAAMGEKEKREAKHQLIENALKGLITTINQLESLSYQITGYEHPVAEREEKDKNPATLLSILDTTESKIAMESERIAKLTKEIKDNLF